MAQLERAPPCLCILLVAHTRHGRYVEPCAVGHILENHGLQISLVALLKIFALYVDDGLHGDIQRMPPLFHGIDETLCTLHLLLGIEQSLLVFAVHLGTAFGISVYQFVERRRHKELGHMSTIDAEGHGAVVCRINDKVGSDLLQVHAVGFTQCRPRFGVQFQQFGNHLLHRVVSHAQRIGNPVPPLVHEIVEASFHHRRHFLLQHRCLSAGNLQQQTFLQRFGAYARRVEGLQYLHHLGNLFFGGEYVAIQGQFVAQRVHVLAQQSVGIQRPDDIFHDVFLLVGEFHFQHLFLQFVIERGAVAVGHFLIVGRLLAAPLGKRSFGHLVVHAYTGQGIVKGILALFALLSLVIVIAVGLFGQGFCPVVHVHHSVGIIHLVRVTAFQCGIVVQFRTHALLQLGEGHLQHFHQHHLLLGEPLHLHLLLLLCLY